MKQVSNTTKLHPNLCQAVVDGLFEVFFNDKYADKVIQNLLKRDKRWGSKDRKFIAEQLYDIVRWKRLIKALGKLEEKPKYLWDFLGVWLQMKHYTLPKWEKFSTTPPIDMTIMDSFPRAISASIPTWMDTLCETALGNDFWEKELEALNTQAPIIIRTNTHKTSKKDLQNNLKKEGIDTLSIENYPDALQLVERKNIFTSSLFQEGLFELQDASSQLVAPFLEVKSGMRVIDSCAGAGGKTLHLASQMQNKGQLIALDVVAWKLNELRKRAKRNGFSIIEPRLIDSTKVIKRLYHTADRLLIDAPCSGLGVLRRNPDTKWKLQIAFIENIKKTQAEILENYSKMLKTGGKLVYATCSILPSENRVQINQFLAQHADFELEEERACFAHIDGFDGFYMARLVKK